MKTIRDYTHNDFCIVWMENYLEERGKKSIDELTVEELKVMIESEKDAIEQESIWLGDDDYYAEGNIHSMERYIEVLNEIIADKEEPTNDN